MSRRLGKLVSITQRRREASKPVRRFLWIVVCVAMLIGVVFVTSVMAKTSFKPRKLVVLNTSMVSTEEILDATGICSDDSYSSLLRKTQDYDESSARWLKSVTCESTWNWTIVLDPAERLPLLRVVAGNAKYWLCDDGTLAGMDVENDHGGVFDRIRNMPNVELLQDHGVGSFPEAELLLTVAGNCQALMPGMIATIRISSEGEINLTDQGGLEIRLGQPSELETKLSALPKALRICESDRSKLDFLDASNPRIFYENWTEPLE